MTCRNFKDYTVWQEAMNLACKIYELIRNYLTKKDLLFVIK